MDDSCRRHTHLGYLGALVGTLSKTSPQFGDGVYERLKVLISRVSKDLKECPCPDCCVKRAKSRMKLGWPHRPPDGG